LVFNEGSKRDALIEKMKSKDILSVFHYLSLHKSQFYSQQGYPEQNLPHSDRYSDCLLRLPFYFELSNSDIQYIVDAIIN